MTRVLKVLVPVLAVVAVALTGGFYVFATSVGSYVRHDVKRADGIVVLTGGEDRVATGIQLISAGQGRRLLISGVHPKTMAPGDIQRRLGGNSAIFNCCVDLGREAHDTIGNAEETRDWAAAHAYRSLIVVTSSYHMPRSMAELSRTMPDVELIPYPVPSRTLRMGTWWQHRPTARLLVGEYLKFLSSAARLGASRLWSGLMPRSTVAAHPSTSPWPAVRS